VSLEKALARLPKELEEREVETRVQMELLKTLTSMRYNPPPTKHAQRPKKSQKLPPGASYTCKVQEKPNKIVEEEEEAEEAAEEAEESSSSSCNSEDEEEGDPRRKSLRTKQKGKSVPSKKKGKAPLSKKSQQLPARKKNQETDEEEEEVMVSSSNSNSNSEGEEDEEPKKKPSKKKGKAPLSKKKAQSLLVERFQPAKKSLPFTNLSDSEEEQEEEGGWEEPAAVTKKRSLMSMLKPSGDCSDFSFDSDSEEDRSKAISNILVRLEKKHKMDEGERAPISVEENLSEEESADDKTTLVYPPESFVVAIYQNDWYVGQVLSKDGQPEAEEGDQYLLVSFMERFHGNTFKWPNKKDILNVVKDDILFICDPPVPSAATSSTRVINNLSLSEKDFKTANLKFQHTQAYYPTKKITAGLLFFHFFHLLIFLMLKRDCGTVWYSTKAKVALTIGTVVSKTCL
jgi:hypothetical protein